MQTQAQQQMEEENRALQAELQSLGQQVRETEKSMSEISALSQMFSQQVSLQSEKTLQLYNQVLYLQFMLMPFTFDSDSKASGYSITVTSYYNPNRSNGFARLRLFRDSRTEAFCRCLPKISAIEGCLTVVQRGFLSAGC